MNAVQDSGRIPTVGENNGEERTPAQISACLQAAYAAVLRDGAWPVILYSFGLLLGTGKAMYIRLDRTHPRDSVTEVVGVSHEVATALRNRNVNDDPLWHPLLAQPAGRVFRSSELLSLDRIHAAPLYAEIGLPAGIGFGVGAILENNASHFSVVGYLRADGEFDDGAKQMLDNLVPHLQVLQKLERQMAAATDAQREAQQRVDRHPSPMIVLDRSGYVLLCNGAAQSLLAAVQGFGIRFGRFFFDDLTTQTAFERALRLALAMPINATRGGPDGAAAEAPLLRVPRPSGGSPYVLSLIPLRQALTRVVLPEGAGCMVSVYDQEHVGALPTERLVWLYRLTPAEARICQAIYRSGTISAAAREVSLTHHTVRSHLKSIYAKVGVTNQSQLMQRLALGSRQLGGSQLFSFD